MIILGNGKSSTAPSLLRRSSKRFLTSCAITETFLVWQFLQKLEGGKYDSYAKEGHPGRVPFSRNHQDSGRWYPSFDPTSRTSTQRFQRSPRPLLRFRDPLPYVFG